MRGGKRSTSIRPGEVRNPQGKNQYAPGAAAAGKKIIADVKELAKQYTAEALERIVSIMRNDAAPPCGRARRGDPCARSRLGKAEKSRGSYG